MGSKRGKGLRRKGENLERQGEWRNNEKGKGGKREKHNKKIGERGHETTEKNKPNLKKIKKITEINKPERKETYNQQSKGEKTYPPKQQFTSNKTEKQAQPGKSGRREFPRWLTGWSPPPPAPAATLPFPAKTLGKVRPRPLRSHWRP